MKKKAGFFGGTFDPVHLGHINLAIEIFEKLKLDKILFCPANISPLKTSFPKASCEDRYNMLKEATKDFSKIFEVLDLEIKRQSPSYTIDSLNELKKDYELRLIVSEEILDNFHLWKDFEKILKIAPPVVGCRKKNLHFFKNEYFSLPYENFIKTPIFEISSTAIRSRIKKRRFVQHLLTKEVLDYIYKHELYL